MGDRFDHAADLHLLAQRMAHIVGKVVVEIAPSWKTAPMRFLEVAAAMDHEIQAVITDGVLHRRAGEMGDRLTVVGPAFFFGHHHWVGRILGREGQASLRLKRPRKDDCAIATHGVSEDHGFLDPMQASVTVHQIQDLFIGAGGVVPAAQGVGDEQHMVLPAHVAGAHELLGLFAGVGLADTCERHDQPLARPGDRGGASAVGKVKKRRGPIRGMTFI